MNTESSTSRTLHVFLIRGLIAIVWAAVFAVVADSLTVGAGVLLVVYPLIDVVASLVDARTQQGSARQVLLTGAATSALAAIALGIAAFGSVANVYAVFGVWAVVSGAAQFVTALRRRAQLGLQFPMLAAGGVSVLLGVGFLIAAATADLQLNLLAIYAATGGIDFIVEAYLLVRSTRRPAPVVAVQS